MKNYRINSFEDIKTITEKSKDFKDAITFLKNGEMEINIKDLAEFINITDLNTVNKELIKHIINILLQSIHLTKINENIYMIFPVTLNLTHLTVLSELILYLYPQYSLYFKWLKKTQNIYKNSFITGEPENFQKFLKKFNINIINKF